jgi:hypothetical protein
MNGFVKQQLDLSGMQPHTHQFKQCGKCQQDKPPEGGIQMSLNKWYCARCWANRATRTQKNA